VGASIFERVAGPHGPARHEVIFAPGGERWFAGDRPIRRVHGNSSMFAGGISALLPGWARWPLRLPRLPVAEAAIVRPAGQAAVQAIRWATAARPAAEAS